MILKPSNLDQKALDQVYAAARCLKVGGVVAFPTETVYGLGAEVANATAVRRIFTIKQRPINHPLIVHIGDLSQLTYWAQAIPKSAWILARRFWPGPLTLILQRNKNVPDYVTGGQSTVGIRIPAHPVALALLNAIGSNKAIAAPSANLYGKISPTSAVHVATILDKKVDMILEGGDCEIGLESTIVGFDRETVSVLRPGGISLSALEWALNKPVILAKNEKRSVRVSGSSSSHYSPTTPLELYPATELYPAALKLAAQNLHVVVISWSNHHPTQFGNPRIQHISMPADPVNYGKQLYATLHQHDQAGFDHILMETPPAQPEWLAITDRLQRARNPNNR